MLALSFSQTSRTKVYLRIFIIHIHLPCTAFTMHCAHHIPHLPGTALTIYCTYHALHLVGTVLTYCNYHDCIAFYHVLHLTWVGLTEYYNCHILSLPCPALNYIQYWCTALTTYCAYHFRTYHALHLPCTACCITVSKCTEGAVLPAIIQFSLVAFSHVTKGIRPNLWIVLQT